MPKYIKPMSPPNGNRVGPIDPAMATNANMTAGEKLLFDTWAQEQVRKSGTPIEYFLFDKKASKVDPLYGEVTDKMWRGPYNIVGQLDWPAPKPEMREEGYRTTHVATAWIARPEFEDIKLTYPRRGDIVRVWKLPYFDNEGSNEENVPVHGYFFNVVDVNDDGHMLDNPDFTGFKLELRRYSEFTPERRIFPP
jgi:hypothetical protein